MKIGDICNRDVVVVGPDESVGDAARLMRQYHVGSVVVVRERSGERFPIGILTDRDLVVEVLAQDIGHTRVVIKDIMSAELLTANESDDLLQTIKRMRNRGVRRLPVIKQSGALAGIIAVDDIIGILANQLNDMILLFGKEQQQEERHRHL